MQSDWLPTLAGLAGIATPHTNRRLDGFDQWKAINGLARTQRKSVVHNVPVSGYEGAVRLGDFKLLFNGMQTVPTGLHSQRQPPQGFTPKVADVFPAGVNVTLGGQAVLTWLFDATADPMELTNLACANDSLLHQYQHLFARSILDFARWARWADARLAAGAMARSPRTWPSASGFTRTTRRRPCRT